MALRVYFEITYFYPHVIHYIKTMFYYFSIVQMSNFIKKIMQTFNMLRMQLHLKMFQKIGPFISF